MRFFLASFGRVALTLALIGPLPSVALAQSDGSTDATDRETARKLMDKGRASYEAGDYDAALTAFEGADIIMGVTTTGLWVGKTLVELGRLVEARDRLYKVSRIPEPPQENEVLARARKEAAALQASIAPRIPEVTLNLDGWDGESQLKVSIDGDEIRTDIATLPRGLNPGPHDLSIKAADYATVKLTFTLGEGEQKKLRVVLTPGEGELEEEPEPQPNPVPVGDLETESGISPLVWVGVGVAGAGVLVGSITGGLSLADASSAKEGCNGNVCPVENEIDADRSLALSYVATTSFAVAGVGAVIGIVGLFVGGDEPTPADTSGLTVQPFIGPTTLGLQGTW